MNYNLAQISSSSTRKKKKAFTLIELLIVIAIIGILAGIVLAVINPTKQRAKAQEAVMRSNLAKVCQAVVSCQSSLSKMDTAECDTFTEVGVVSPNQPEGATYEMESGGTSTGADGWVGARAALNSCGMRCRVINDFSDWNSKSPGTVVINTTWTGGGGTECSIQE